jgi:hypothetical protein
MAAFSCCFHQCGAATRKPSRSSADAVSVRKRNAAVTSSGKLSESSRISAQMLAAFASRRLT